MNKRLLSALLLFVAAAVTTPLLAQTNFATLATDGAWTWFNDPRALFHDGKLYFGYVRAADGKTALDVFDPSTGESTNVWNSGFTQRDDHNNPGLLAKQDGMLLAVYARHISDQYFAYRRSTGTNPVTTGEWAPEQTIPNSGAGMTYANPFQLSSEAGKIYNFCRNQNFNPTIYTSTDGGSNWSAPQLFIATGGGLVRPYVKYASDYDQRIDFLYTDGHPRDVSNSLYHFYYQGGAIYKTDGTFVKSYASLPILHDSGERGSVIYQYSSAAQSDPNEWIPAGRAWCWEIANDTNGSPVCVFTVQNDFAPVGEPDPTWTDDRIYYYYARWTGDAWQKRFIAHAGRPLYSAEDDYAGGICVDPVDPNCIYISSNAQDPFNLADTTNVPLRANNRYELWRGVTSDGGLTFSWTQITTNSAVDNLRPYVPRRNGGEPCVIWFRGTYSTYTSYSCAVVGLFTSDVPKPPETPMLNYLDATSGADGNTTLADGSTFSPPLNGTTGMDNDWEERTVFGSGGNIFESGGEAAENAPELVTTIAGLTSGATYAIHVFFWDAASTTENWSIRAGFTSHPGANPLYSAPDAADSLGANSATLASRLIYTNPPTIFAEANRLLLAASLGNVTADAHGEIKVFIDDRPSPIGANNRTWYDGLAYAQIIHPTPTNLTFTRAEDTLTVSWPASHLGWLLQAQTNGLTGGLSTNWVDVSSSGSVTMANFAIDPANPAVFFRLRRP